MSKRKIKNGVMEEPFSSLPSQRGEEPSDPAQSIRHAEQSNGAGNDSPDALSSEPIDHEPKLSSSVDADSTGHEPPPAPQPVLPSVADVPVAKLAPPLAELSPLEQRIRRLEAALAHLQGARQSALPDQERFTDQRPPASPTVPAPAAAGKGLLDKVRRSIARTDPPAAPPPEPASAAALVLPAVRRKWLLMDVTAELRAMFRMFVDPRYRMSKLGWLVPVLLFAGIVTSGWWVIGTSIPFIGTWLNKAVDLALAYALFKVLTHEARRYRETAPDLPPNLRL